MSHGVVDFAAAKTGDLYKILMKLLPLPAEDSVLAYSVLLLSTYCTDGLCASLSIPGRYPRHLLLDLHFVYSFETRAQKSSRSVFCTILSALSTFTCLWRQRTYRIPKGARKIWSNCS